MCVCQSGEWTSGLGGWWLTRQTSQAVCLAFGYKSEVNKQVNKEKQSKKTK